MNKLILFTVFGNFAATLIYALILKNARKNDIFPILLILVLIPVYGLIIIGVFDMMKKKKSSCTIELISKEEDKAKKQVIDECTLTIEEILCSMPIDDIFMINDVMLRREMLFKAVKGDCLRLYPFLKKMLNDRDSEVVHYAAAAITNYTQEINDNFRFSKDRYLRNPSDHINYLQYIDDFIELILWEELNDRDMSEERKNLKEELELVFNSERSVGEKYYIENIKDFKNIRMILSIDTKDMISFWRNLQEEEFSQQEK